jgi:hypothetical protein
MVSQFAKDKGGWIRLVEVFVSIMLLVGVMLIISTNNSSGKSGLQEEITNKEVAMLRDIELNNTMRTEILNIAQASLPLEWEDIQLQIPEVSNRINSLTPKNLECVAKICILSDVCTVDWNAPGDVYVKAVVISADLNNYSPRQLKLFCSMKSD